MPLNDLVQRPERVVVSNIRTEPIQERSVTRIEALLDAAAEVVDEVGFDRMTTAMVSERAKASIGTVYRYFPDRIALLQGLRDRAMFRFRTLVAERIQEKQPKTWQEAVDICIDAYIDLYRSEKGFRIMRFVDSQRGGAAATADESQLDPFAKLAAGILADDFSLPADELSLRLAVAVEIATALVGRAFEISGEPDARFIDEARRAIKAYLGTYYS